MLSTDYLPAPSISSINFYNNSISQQFIIIILILLTERKLKQRYVTCPSHTSGKTETPTQEPYTLL